MTDLPINESNEDKENDGSYFREQTKWVLYRLKEKFKEERKNIITPERYNAVSYEIRPGYLTVKFKNIEDAKRYSNEMFSKSTTRCIRQQNGFFIFHAIERRNLMDKLLVPQNEINLHTKEMLLNQLSDISKQLKFEKYRFIFLYGFCFIWIIIILCHSLNFF